MYAFRRCRRVLLGAEQQPTGNGDLLDTGLILVQGERKNVRPIFKTVRHLREECYIPDKCVER